MKKIYLYAIVFLVSACLIGCGQEEEVSNQHQTIDFDVIASEKSLPADFHEIAFERKEVPFFSYLIKKVEAQSEFENVWKLYGFENEIPNVDFDHQAIVFVGLQESGSCPNDIKNVTFDAEHGTLFVSLSVPDGNCTSDATPRTFVLQVDQEVAKQIESVQVLENEVETNVPLDF